MTRDSLRRALRTFLITTLALFIPGLLGWLNDVTSWAQGNGERPFPDGHGLLFLAVSACVAGVVAVVNLLWNLVEDAAGRGVLRTVPSRDRGDVGAMDRAQALVLAYAVTLVLVVVIIAAVNW